MTDQRARVRAVGYGVAGAALAAVAVTFSVLADVGWVTLVDTYTLTNLVIGLGCLLPGVAIRWFHRHNRIGTLLAVSGLGALGTAAAAMLLTYGLHQHWPPFTYRVLTTVHTGAWQLGVGFCFNIAVLLFPTQRLPSTRWRPVLWLAVISGVYQLGTGIVSPHQTYDDPRAVSILSIGFDIGSPYIDIMGYLYLVATLAIMASLVVRYRRGDERIKGQILWLLLALIAFVLINFQRFVMFDGPILLLLSFALFPIAMGIAIVRYELFDIRLIVSRTLVYTATLGVVIAAYAGLVTLLSLTISDQLRRGVPVGVALVIAMGFNPIRLLLQRLIDRAFYGSRSDPAGTARTIVTRLQSSDELADVLERIRVALRLPWLALDRARDGLRLAEVGTPSAAASAIVELSYHDAPVGALLLGLRRGETALHDADRRALDLICAPLAIALHATALSEEVSQARTATVEAAAIERVRLQRDLHDGLGPTLTSIAFRIDAATNHLRTNVDRAEELMDDVGADLRNVITDVRRIVHGLRPIELDELGVVAAIRQQLANARADATHSVAVELTAANQLPALSPAAELAAYRIVMESITNVQRHSAARACHVTIAADDGHLDLTIVDRGAPPTDWRPGVGIRSIRDRAEELGGTAVVGPHDQGWMVHARLPLGPDPDNGLGSAAEGHAEVVESDGEQWATAGEVAQRTLGRDRPL